MIKWVLPALIFLVACNPTGDATGYVTIEDNTSDIQSIMVSLEQTKELREELKAELQANWSGNVNRRELYERDFDQLGVNGILDVLHDIDPTCHYEAHDLGKIVFAKLQAVGPALEACNDGCYSACMHGVMMEAFATADDHVQIKDIMHLFPTFCFDEQITELHKPGDCAHGVGHALMFLSNYQVADAVDACSGFEDKVMEYYCATGAYMEYNTQRKEEDSKTQPLFYPCDANKFPAACFRYKMLPVLSMLSKEHGLNAISMVAKECEALDGFYRLGCFHGFGNAHMAQVYAGFISIKTICGFGTEQDQYVCIEGVIERLAKFHKDTALKACEDLDGEFKQVCIEAAEGDMYRLDKSFELYFK